MFGVARTPEKVRVAIVGGGVSGLTAAFRCAQHGYVPTLFEACERLGGSLWTERDGDFLIEHGAQSFDLASGVVGALAEELGLAPEVIRAKVTRTYGFDGRSLLVLDPGESASPSEAPSTLNGERLATFRRGMGQLVDALASKVAARGEIHLRTPIRRLEPTVTGWRLISAGGASRDFDAIIISSGAHTASRLLSEIFGAPALALRAARSIPVVSVSLAFSRSAIAAPLDAAGFVTGFGVELDDCMKCSFVSSVFEGRAPEGSALLRAFLRPREAEMEAPLQTFRERATRAMTRALRARDAPVKTWEACFRDGFAVFDEEQLRRVTLLERALGRMPIALSGTVFHGAGVDGAVRSAANAVFRLRRLS